MPGYELWSDKERKEVNDVLQTGILMRYGFDGARKGIWKSLELEKAICTVFGSKYAQLTSSGTSALTTALSALGIGYGDEVITPSFTFVASFEAVLSVGAVPVLVDVDDTLTMDPQAVRKAITPKTKAVMPVHMCGSMADMDALVAICKEHKLILLEDACQSIGATYKGRSLGTIGDAGTFSFDFVKTMTCAEGGVVMTNDASIHTLCDGYTDHGHDHKGVDRGAQKFNLVGQFAWVFPCGTSFIGAIYTVADINMPAITVPAPPCEQFFIRDLIVPDFEIKLRCHIVDPTFFEP